MICVMSGNIPLSNALKRILDGNVTTHHNFTRFYSVDSSLYEITPQIIVTPKHAKDVSETIKLVREYRFSGGVTVRGAGTGLVGGALGTGVILDMCKFNKVDIDKQSRTVTVGAGLLRGDLDVALVSSGMIFAPNPSIGSFSSIGGMLGCNSCGSRSLKYGCTIDNVGSVTFVDGRGDITTLPDRDNPTGDIIAKIAQDIDRQKFPKTTKNSSGYRLDAVLSAMDSHKALIGSEGTLGVFLSATLGIIPKPRSRVLYIVEYSNAYAAAMDCPGIVQTHPTALEFVDKTILEKYNDPSVFNTDTSCLLFVEYDGYTSGDIASKCIKSATTRCVTISDTVTDENQIDLWWRHRDRSLHYTIVDIHKDTEEDTPSLIEDAAVPVEQLPALFVAIDKITRTNNARVVTYGHAGNGNIHVRLICAKGGIDLADVARTYFESIIKLDGTITAEHGDGLARTPYVSMLYGKKNMRQFTRLKMALDPDGILNPGKIVSMMNTTM